jgi:hypothetical protein
MRVIITALAAPALALGMAVAAVQVVGSKPVPPTGRATSVVWADRVYSSRHELAHWLRAHGTTYRSWATNHPASAAILSGRPRLERTAMAHLARTGAPGKPHNATRGTELALLSIAGLVVLLAAWRLRRRALPAPRMRVRARVPERSQRRLNVGSGLPSISAGAASASRAMRRSRGPLAATSSALPAVAVSAAAAVRGIARTLPPRRERRLERTEYGSALPPGLVDVARQHGADIGFAIVSIVAAVVVGLSLSLYLN